jgi:glutathione S-transferase
MDLVYGFSRTDRSARVQWLLTELGQTFEFRKLVYRDGDQSKPDYIAMNPLGMSPTFRSGELVLFESCGICLFLADRHLDAKLAPELDSPERADYVKWMFFTGATLDAKLGEADRAEETLELSRRAEIKKELGAICDVYETRLSARSHLLNSGFSAADIVTAVGLNWIDVDLLKSRPAIQAYLNRMKARPAALKAKSFDP